MRPSAFSALLCLLALPAALSAQFHLNGAAKQVNDSCWTLTEAVNTQAGSIWNLDKVDLSNSFQVIMELQFGCKDANGADGILFGFQPLSTSIGTTGEGLGFQGVMPSLGIEFDTWQNDNLNDPSFDHIAVSRNGDLNHGGSNNLAGPVQASPVGPNIEDCNWHKLRVNWDAADQVLEVWFDCDLRLSYQGDIVQDVFGGDPQVFWGFTASTGGASNLQQVCYSYTTFLDGFEDVTICPGGQYQLQVGGGIQYQWTPATGLSNPGIPNPVAAPAQTTTYVVEVTDACNNPLFDSITVTIDGDTVFFDLGPDTVLCQGETLLLDATSFGTDTVNYLWSSGQSSATISTSFQGLYAVTVTVDGYCVADDRVFVQVTPLPVPLLPPGDTVLCLGQTLMLEPVAAADFAIEWEDGSSDPVRGITSDGIYRLLVYNDCGERSSAVRARFEDCRQVYFPNAFTPDGDGINDVFLPFDNGDVDRVLLFQVFDRWGGLVFDRSDIRPNAVDQGWDGTAYGRAANPGAYVWRAAVRFRDGVTEDRQGSVLLLR
ncbi:MAG: hypothetical protein RLY31_3189 [Bacteroidota bacterium]|jgi:gliding motility-associated-like protein